MSDLFVVENTKDVGKIIIAAKNLQRGQIIKSKERPFIWNSINPTSHQSLHEFCDDCGLVLKPQFYEETKNELLRSCSVDVANEMVQMMKDMAPSGQLNSPNQVKCQRDCHKLFCCEDCRVSSVHGGHDWLCESLQLASNHLLQQLAEMDTKGHYRLACKLYARIASQTLLDVQENESINIAEHSLLVAEKILGEYCCIDFARTMHVSRTGRIDIDENMFETMLFPAYFSGYLETPLAITKNIFRQSGSILWANRERNEAFLSSQIFSDKFYSRMIGMFVVNCLSVYVSSPFDEILSQTISMQNRNKNQDKKSHSALDEHKALMIDQIVEYLQTKLRTQQQYLQTEDEEEDEGAAKVKPVVHSFQGMSGTGLFPLFSKTNHSCVCNTSMHGSDRVSVTIMASQDIAAGEEITNCYIHHHSLGSQDQNSASSHTNAVNEQHKLNSNMTKKQRYRALRQYVFECHCPLCESQVIDSDEDSDY